MIYSNIRTPFQRFPFIVSVCICVRASSISTVEEHSITCAKWNVSDTNLCQQKCSNMCVAVEQSTMKNLRSDAKHMTFHQVNLDNG